MALTDNLIAYYKCDESGGANDLLDAHSVGPYNLTQNGSPGSDTGIINTARTYSPASSQYFFHTDNADFSSGDVDFTISAWVFLNDTTPNPIVTKHDFGAGNHEYLLMQDNSSYYSTGTRFVFVVSNDGSNDVILNANNFGVPSTSTWYHVVAWHDSVNNQIGIAVNAGTADTASHSTGVNDSGSDFRIGNYAAGTELLNGRVDEVGFWKRVLTSQERTDLYNGGAGLSYSNFGGAVAPVNLRILGTMNGNLLFAGGVVLGTK